MIGATGLQMMRLAGEIGDGALLNYLVSPAYNEGALAALTEGAARAGRTLDDIDRPQLVVCSMDEDREAALDAARLLVTQYLGQQPHIMKASGVPRVAARRDRQGAHLAGDARRRRHRVEAGARRRRAADHGVGHARRVPGQGGRVRGDGVHVSGAVPARGRRRGDDRRVRGMDAVSVGPTMLSNTDPALRRAWHVVAQSAEIGVGPRRGAVARRAVGARAPARRRRHPPGRVRRPVPAPPRPALGGSRRRRRAAVRVPRVVLRRRRHVHRHPRHRRVRPHPAPGPRHDAGGADRTGGPRVPRPRAAGHRAARPHRGAGRLVRARRAAHDPGTRRRRAHDRQLPRPGALPVRARGHHRHRRRAGGARRDHRARRVRDVGDEPPAVPQPRGPRRAATDPSAAADPGAAVRVPRTVRGDPAHAVRRRRA